MDIDGTIAESGQSVSVISRSVLNELLRKNDSYELGIVGGGKYEKIINQLEDLSMTHIFSENGCVYHKNGKEQFRKNIRSHPLYSHMNILVKLALAFLANVDYLLTGQLIDLRSGIIYISLIGTQANLEERAYFIALDKQFKYREKLLKILKDKTTSLGIADRIDVLLGGSVGIGIHPHEWDKVQVLDHIDSNYESIHYFGDKYEPDGNDYRLLNDSRVIGHKVNSVKETVEILLTL